MCYNYYGSGGGGVELVYGGQRCLCVFCLCVFCACFCLFACLCSVCVCLSVRLSVYLYLSVCVPVWQFNNTAGFLKSKTNKTQALGLIRSRLRLNLGVSVKFRLGQLRLVEWKWSCRMWILKIQFNMKCEMALQ